MLTQAGEALCTRARAIQQQIKLAEDEVRVDWRRANRLFDGRSDRLNSPWIAWPICWASYRKEASCGER